MDTIAGETIKGLNVVIGSDTTALTAALSDVNKASRGIQSELKQVERLLKLDPSNTELIAQKQQLLTEAISNTSEKLNALRSAQEQVNEQFARGEITAGQYRAFQREIAATEQQLRRFEERASESVESLNDLGEAAESNADKLQNISEKVKGAGEKMTAGITAPIAAAGGLMLKGAVDAENAQGKLQASLGITADAAADLEAVAQSVWVNGFGENIEEANDAIITVRKNMGNLAEDELDKVTQGAMTIADVFGAEVADSTKAAGTMMKNFGISGQEALDLITVGFQKGGDYSGELLDTLNEYSPQFASMGISADQAMGILIAGAQAGSFSLDKVGDAMKEFNIRAQDGSDATAQGFDAIGLNAKKMGESIAKGGEDAQSAFMATVTALAAMKNPIEQNAAGTALFGTQWEDVRAKVIVAMADGIKGIGEFEGATQDAAKAMYDNNPGLALTMAMRELQLAIGPALLPLADIIKNTIVPAVKSMADGFNNLSPAGQKTALAMAGIAAAIGPLLLIIGTLAGMVGSIAGAFTAASGAIAAAGGVMAIITGPIGIAIAIITALATAAYLIVTNWEPIKEFFGNLWTSVVTTMAVAWEGIKQFFSELPAAISESLTSVIESITQWGSNLIAWAQTTIPMVIDSIAVFFDELPSKIGYALGYALGSIIKFGLDAANWVASEVPKIIAGVATFFSELPTKIATTFIDVITEFGKWGTSVINWITTEVPRFISSIVNFYAQLPGKVMTVLTQVLTNLKTWARNILTTVSTEVPKITESIISFFAALPDDILTIGENIVKGLWTGMGNMTSWLKDKIKSFAEGIISGMKEALGIHSPSTVMMEIGEFTGEGFIEGIKKTLGEVSRQAEKMANAAIPDVSLITKGLNNPVSVGSLPGSGTVLNINISNEGTLVGTNGMNEFADIMSRKIAGSFGLGTGGDF